ncbi:MAG TPA: cardiolipin synthase [Chitinophagales bacterium]|nr:cardiolipin synthase [Chitinophagales bacterium]
METFLLVIYSLVVIGMCIRIIMYSQTPSSALAYLLLVITFPVFGIIFYLSVGFNYRKRKIYQKKIDIDDHSFPELEEKIRQNSLKTLLEVKDELGRYYSLAKFLKNKSFISYNNKVDVFINGEEKFPQLIKDLLAAKHHIHIEYYIFENDVIGNQIAEILIQKAQEGVEIRVIYDDFGSQSIRKKFTDQLNQAGVETSAFYKVFFILLANRLNYRNHRKIIVIDGTIGYIGGINIGDNYINSEKNQLYWRDTHIKIEGLSVINLQYTFLSDWNFCSGQNIGFSLELFPIKEYNHHFGEQLVQIIPSGPDSDYPSTMYSLIQIILMAKRELQICTPYFIPDKSFLDAVKIAALSGVNIQLLVPGISDSKFVNIISQSHYEEMLEVGVRIFRYNKGFIHAKTLICDEFISVVGSANLDNRSFELNFEINAMVYDKVLAEKLKIQFTKDLESSTEINKIEWINRPLYKKAIEKVLHLFSPLV